MVLIVPGNIQEKIDTTTGVMHQTLVSFLPGLFTTVNRLLPKSYFWSKAFSTSLTLMQAVSAARTPWITVWSRFCAFFTRISSDDLHPGVIALTLERHHAPLGSHEIFACLIYW